MGKIFNTNTWRAPLQLIDCWLPLPGERRARSAVVTNAGHAVQRFARAGWLHREAANGPSLRAGTVAAFESGAPSGRPVRVLRQPDGLRAHNRDARLFVSGSMNDVCAELDRLAALEQASVSRAA